MPGRLEVRRFEGLLVVPFAAAGVAVTLTTPDRGTEKWAVWVVVVMAMTAGAGAVFVYGVRRWRELHDQVTGDAPVKSSAKPGLRPLASRIAVFYVAAAAGGATYSAVTLSVTDRVDWRGGLLLTIVGIGVLPALAVVAAIGYAADAEVTSDHADEVARIGAYRRLMHQLLSALGGLIALLVAAQATAAARHDNPSTVVTVLFGAAASTLVAITYAPAASQLRKHSLDLIEAWLPLGNATGAALLDLAEQRAKAAGLLGADKSLFGDLQTNVAIVGPLLAGAAAVFLP